MSTEKQYHTRSSEREMDPTFIAESECMKTLCRQVNRIARTEATVLLSSESGTGKEIVSHMIHRRSGRSEGSFVTLNCGAIPKDLVESELFGHEKGAFTGADRQKQGCFELANGGTLFLDEIGEMEPAIQVKLLRAVEQKSFRRVGGSKEINTDVRIIAATNRDLSRALEKGDFRKDLFYRLSVIELHIPPLRERRVDIPPLARHFMGRFSGQYECEEKRLTEESLRLLRAYDWPGNVRQLKNAIERCVILSPESRITPDVLTNEIYGLAELEKVETSGNGVLAGPPLNGSEGGRPTAGAENDTSSGAGHVNIPVGASVEEAERLLIRKTLSMVGNNKSEAARILGFSRQTLHNKLNKYGEA